MDGWIMIPNWERFQNYKERTPPWIKVYLELNHKDEWLDLTDGARGLQVRIWLLYADSHRTLKLSQVQRQGWTRHSAGHLKSLIDAGFVEISTSKPRIQRREEVLKEKKELKERAHAQVKKPVGKAALEPKTNAAAYKPFNDQLEKPWPPDEWLADA